MCFSLYNNERTFNEIERQHISNCKRKYFFYTMHNQPVGLIPTMYHKGQELSQIHKRIRCLMDNENIHR